MIVGCYLGAVAAAMLHSPDWSFIRRMVVIVGLCVLAHMASFMTSRLRARASRLRRHIPTLEEARAAADLRAVAAGRNSRIGPGEFST